MAKTDKSKKYYRLVHTNWTGKETFKGDILEKGAIVSVSSEDLKNKELKRRLAVFFVELSTEEAKAHEKVLGTEHIESEPITLIDNSNE